MPLSTGATGLEHATVLNRDGSVALREVTLLAEPGELLAVLGPSGSGKSTLLRAIAGLVRLTSGQVLIDGATVTDAPTERRNVAMVFEQGQLMPLFDVAKNLSFPLELRHVPDELSRELVAEQARDLDLTNLLPRLPSTLSRGEQGRAGIARALVRAPSAFLLDEPLAHVDAGERIRLRHHIREVVKRAGVTTLYVTHEQTEALSIGDRVAVLKDGEVVALAPPRELYEAPADTFVATFVGAVPITLLAARVVVSAEMAGYQIGARTLPTWLPLPATLEAYRDRPVLLGIRAEDVREEPRPDDGTLTGMVTMVECTGRHATISLRIGDDQLMARVDGRTTLRIGSIATVGVDAARAHVFDPDTGRALAHPAIR